MRKAAVASVLALLVASFWLRCSSGKSDGDDGDTSSAADDGGDDGTSSEVGKLGISSELAATYPEGLAVTAFPQAVDASPGEAAVGTIQIETALHLNGPTSQSPDDSSFEKEFDPFTKHPKDRAKEIHERLSGKADDCISGDAIAALHKEARNGADACFGFDYGIVSGEALGDIDLKKANDVLVNVTDESLAGVREALSAQVTPDQVKEACMVKVGRQMVEQAASRLEGSLRVFEGMLCQAKKEGLSLPAIGKSIDVRSAFANQKGGTFTEASIARLQDRNGRPVFRSRVKFSINGGPAAGENVTVTLVHSPSAEGNTSYDGVMWIKSDGKDTEHGNNHAFISSMSYAKSGTDAADQRLKMEIRKALVNTDAVTARFVLANGKLDFNAGASADNEYAKVDGRDPVKAISHFAFDVNPSTYAGNLAFWANPGGTYKEIARGFVYQSSQQSDGTLAGCAYAGAWRGGSIRLALKEGKKLEPTGCFTPQLSYGACGVSGDNVGTQIWKQCFKQQSDGHYALDTDKIEDDDAGFDVIDLADEQPELPKVDLATVQGVGDVEDAED